MARGWERDHGREPHAIAESVRAVAMPIVRALEVELVDVECVGHGSASIVRVFIDKPGGVNLDDCEQVHVSLGHALDVADPIPHAYRLEVSSPGLDRPLKQQDDYRRAHGKLINVKLRQAIDGQWRIVGRLIETNETGIVLAGSQSARAVQIEWAAIASGRLEVEF
ncbi:MAG TPA: ribosome maturation factor RimP [Nitrospiraceae bacterium]|nr:ribosome maturation factor RimP [Nitrospiraceae bacterium]